MIKPSFEILNQKGTPMFNSDLFANRPTAGIIGRIFISTDTKLIYRDTGSTWELLGNVGTVTSVGISMPSAFNVANSPITGSGTINVTGAGLVSQYIRGDGTLADFPSAGGGSSISYYLNGGTNQGTFGGNTYYQMSKTAVFGSAANFTISADGYIAEFITDAGDPGLLNIPAGSWNIQAYFNASSSGGSPSFYVELYKYDGTTFTSIATSSANPELITGGTSIDLYYTSLAVPATTLTVTDRLAIRIYVTHSGKTITLYTQDGRLAQIITTFSTGITAINSLTAQVQFLATGTSGNDFAITSSGSTHTFDLPIASSTKTGKLSSTDWTTFNNKQNALTNPVTGTGTLNYLAKFSSTGSSITDSLIYDNGTTVFVGTTGNLPNVKFKIDTTSQRALELTTSSGNALFASSISGTYVVTITNGTWYTFFESTGRLNLAGDLLINTIANASTNTNAFLVSDSGVVKYRTAAQVLSDIGGQAALTNPVTGTGTTNYLSKFTGTSTIGNSSIYESSTNILIGTTTPSVFSSPKLTVYTGSYTVSEIRANTEARLELTTDTNGSTPYVEVVNSYGNFFVKVNNTGFVSSTYPIYYDGTSATNRSLKFQTEGTDKLLINQGGNVSIGNSNNTYKLDVSGTGNFTGALSGTSATFSSSVSIGGADQGYNLDVKRSSTGDSTFDTVANFYKASTNNTGLLIRLKNTIVDLAANNITGGGGPTAGMSFSVSSGGSISTALTLASTGAATFSNNVNISTGGGSFQWTNSGNNVAIFADSGYLRFDTGTTGYTERMRITAAGNVGIGTTSPSQKLEVSGSFLVSNGDIIQSSNSVFKNSVHDLYLQTDGAKDIIFRPATVEKMRITSGGEVYIAGTTDQGAYNLQCNGTGVWGAGAYVNGSDIALKENISPILSGLQFIKKLNPVSYNYIQEYSKDQSLQPGFIAQDLLEVFKDEIWVDGIVKKGNEYYNVAYQNLIPILTKAIQEQQAQIEELKLLINNKN